MYVFVVYHNITRLAFFTKCREQRGQDLQRFRVRVRVQYSHVPVFSSPELKPQVSFSDRLSSVVRLSVLPSVCSYICLYTFHLSIFHGLFSGQLLVYYVDVVKLSALFYRILEGFAFDFFRLFLFQFVLFLFQPIAPTLSLHCKHVDPRSQEIFLSHIIFKIPHIS